MKYPLTFFRQPYDRFVAVTHDYLARTQHTKVKCGP